MSAKVKGIITSGIDIGASSVKAVKLLIREGATELLGFGTCQIKNQNSKEEIVQALKDVAGQAKIEERLVNTAVLGNAVIVRYINLPKMTKEELKNAIRFEAEKYVPFNIDEVVLDYQIFEDNLEDNKMRVLLVVAKKDYIKERLTILEEAGFGVRIIDVDSFALANAFFKNFPNRDKNKSVALINIGAKFTDITVLRGELSYFTRTIEFGGDDITKLIAEKLNLSIDDAASLKVNFKPEREAELYEIIKGILSNLCDEIRLSFGYYENQFGRDIDEVFASGGTAKLTHIKEYLAKLLGFEFKPWDPTQFLTLSDALDTNKLETAKFELNVAIGLAIR